MTHFYEANVSLKEEEWTFKRIFEHSAKVTIEKVIWPVLSDVFYKVEEWDLEKIETFNLKEVSEDAFNHIEKTSECVLIVLESLNWWIISNSSLREACNYIPHIEKLSKELNVDLVNEFHSANIIKVIDRLKEHKDILWESCGEVEILYKDFLNFSTNLIDKETNLESRKNEYIERLFFVYKFFNDKSIEILNILFEWWLEELVYNWDTGKFIKK